MFGPPPPLSVEEQQFNHMIVQLTAVQFVVTSALIAVSPWIAHFITSRW